MFVSPLNLLDNLTIAKPISEKMNYYIMIKKGTFIAFSIKLVFFPFHRNYIVGQIGNWAHS